MRLEGTFSRRKKTLHSNLLKELSRGAVITSDAQNYQEEKIHLARIKPRFEAERKRLGLPPCQALRLLTEVKEAPAARSH